MTGPGGDESRIPTVDETTTVDAATARAADGDAWQAHGLIRAGSGGAVAEHPGVRTMASGLPHPQWNNADVHDPSAADVGAVAHWYERQGVPWGFRVPAGAEWRHGRLLFRCRLMALDASTLRPTTADGVTVRAASERDLDDVVAVDAQAFGGDPATAWMLPLLRSSRATVALATIRGRAVATGYALRSDGWAGPSALLAGIGVLPAARRRGVGAALSSWLLQRAFEDGARISVLNPDSDDAARVYSRLGFSEVEGFAIHTAEQAPPAPAAPAPDSGNAGPATS
ncbi:GNAT family N-acetyltransferase [Microbacterium sp.]|uniref:GNAT family N-acetyltransferase n=1 Tax=Microbacterium sp. TaxID=51671 RepID=UPI002810DE53|nr:GNAT family N-acetyltransferase [Microbacterium sp.]